MSDMSLRDEILKLVAKHSETLQPKTFVAGSSPVPVSGRVFDASDVCSLVNSSLDFWLTTGRFNTQFEKELGEFIGAKHTRTVNSGSSANLLAFAALTSEHWKDKAIKPGDEVITVAAGFPTTINPIMQYGCIPVFVDVSLPTYNIDVTQIEKAVTPKTKAIMIAHTLGNPFDLKAVVDIAKKYGLWLIEDCCDALGSTYDNQHVGTFGDMGTLSFYPAHHITMGEGGAIFTNSKQLCKVATSFRDWGRDCWCEPGISDTCNARFKWKLGDLPEGYDHKYIYTELGYNMKITDMQASVGVSQLKHLNGFVTKRRANFDFLKNKLNHLEEYFILPEATKNSEPSWFGFPLSLRQDAPFSRSEFLFELNQKKIGTRMIFGGNLIKQPFMKNRKYKSNELPNTDFIMNQSLWLGVYPGLNEEMLNYIVDIIEQFVKTKTT